MCSLLFMSDTSDEIKRDIFSKIKQRRPELVEMIDGFMIQFKMKKVVDLVDTLSSLSAEDGIELIELVPPKLMGTLFADNTKKLGKGTKSKVVDVVSLTTITKKMRAGGKYRFTTSPHLPDLD